MCRFRIISNVDRGADWNVETQRAYAKLDFLLKKSNSKPMLLEGGKWSHASSSPGQTYSKKGLGSAYLVLRADRGSGIRGKLLVTGSHTVVGENTSSHTPLAHLATIHPSAGHAFDAL